jgi:hypothetical protein
MRLVIQATNDGVSISGPSYIYGDNTSVIHNTQWPKSTLKKKSNSVCYHTVHESEAMSASESRIFWSRIGCNCDHFQNIFWKWSKYIDIKFEYGISTHQINDHNYFNIFNFFFYLFLNVCLIIYKLYWANFSQHFFSIIICTKISDVIFTIKSMVNVFSLWNASELISTVWI